MTAQQEEGRVAVTVTLGGRARYEGSGDDLTDAVRRWGDARRAYREAMLAAGWALLPGGDDEAGDDDR